MSSLLSLFRHIVSLVGRATRWMFGAAKKTTKLPPVVYTILLWLIIILIAVVLGFFSRDLPGGQKIHFQSEFVRYYFWGIIFFLGYVFIRFALYVIRLFFLEEEPEFPDIDEAWKAGVKGLASSGLDIQSLPVFLILGLPEGEEAHFFAGIKLKTPVIAPPVPQKGAALRFFANQDVLFIACSGVSATCRQLQTDVSTWYAQPKSPGDGAAGGGMGFETGMETIQPGQMPLAAQTLQPGQVRPAVRTAVPGTVPPVSETAGGRKPLLSKPELAECYQRLNYLCRLLTRSREPFCPINGMLMSVPFSFASRLKDGIHQVIAADVQGAHEGVQMLFPMVWVFTGLDELPGFTDFARRAAQVDPRFGPHSRAGSRFPMGHPIDGRAAGWVIGRSINWFRQWIYSAFAKDLAAPTNRVLYQFLCELEQRGQPLSNLVRSSLEKAIGDTPIRLAGCYFSGYDRAAQRHVFVRDVVTKLIGAQNEVSWSVKRIRRDYSARNWTYILYAAIAILLVANVALSAYLLLGPGS